MTLDEMMPRRIVTVHLNGEIPKIGQGVRRVVVWSVGPSWVTLRKVGSEKNIQVRRSLWDSILAAKSNVNTMKQEP